MDLNKYERINDLSICRYREDITLLDTVICLLNGTSPDCDSIQN